MSSLRLGSQYVRIPSELVNLCAHKSRQAKTPGPARAGRRYPALPYRTAVGVDRLSPAAAFNTASIALLTSAMGAMPSTVRNFPLPS